MGDRIERDFLRVASTDWMDAVTLVDQTNDRKPLVALLRSGRPPPMMVTDWLAEVLDGYSPPNEEELRVLSATQEYRTLYLRPHHLRRKSDISFEAATLLLSRKHGCSIPALRRCIRGSGKSMLAFRRRLGLP